jgi:hypothetical protein
MNDQLDFLDYPNWPGFRARDTSKAAADAIAPNAETLRDHVLNWFHNLGLAGLTADEAAAWMCRDILSIRPRVAELAKMGRIRDSGQRRKNKSGKSAIVWVRT